MVLSGLDARPITPFIDSQPQDSPPSPASTAAADLDTDAAAAGELERFGTIGQQYLTFGLAVANDFQDATEINAHAAYSTFIAPDVEWILEAGVWYHDQPGDNAFSGNFSTIFRWHLINEDRWSVFIDAGVGALLSTDNVPRRGTSFNFTPRAGVGYTRRIADDGTRLITGLRWHHVSNARLLGGDSNPSRDAPAVFLGVMIPF